MTAVFAKAPVQPDARAEFGTVVSALIGLALAVAASLAPPFYPPEPPTAARARLTAESVFHGATHDTLDVGTKAVLSRLTRSSQLIPGLGGVEGALVLLGYEPGTSETSLAMGRMELLVSRLEEPAEQQCEVRAPVYSSSVAMTVDKTAVHPQDHRILARIAHLYQQGKDKIVFKSKDAGPVFAYDPKRIKLAAVTPATGNLSARFESGSASIRAIGYSVTGGTCYGTYQIASRPGTLSSFFKHLEAKAPDWASRLRAAGKADTGGISGGMPDAWRSIAAEDPGRFAAIQHEFISKTHYEPALRQIYEQTGINLNDYSQAVREVLWSAAVQHGPGGASAMFCQVLSDLKRRHMAVAPGREFEKSLIENVYVLRQKSFGDAPLLLRASVAMRYDREKSNALALLATGVKKPGKLLIIGAKPHGEDS